MSTTTIQVPTHPLKQTGANQHLIFISHSGVDTWVAHQLAKRVRECGAIPFLDEAQIEVGADFEKDILAFLNKTHELVVYITPWALDRPYIWAEIGACWGRQIPIIGLLHGVTLEGVQSRLGLPVFLKKRNLILLNEVEKYFEQLKKRAASLAAEKG